MSDTKLNLFDYAASNIHQLFSLRHADLYKYLN